jgi:hypothetical protein
MNISREQHNELTEVIEDTLNMPVTNQLSGEDGLGRSWNA